MELSSPQTLLPIWISRIAVELQLNLSNQDIECLVSAIQNADGDSLSLDLDAPCAFGETQEEAQKNIQKIIDALSEATPKMQEELEDALSSVIPEMLSKVAEDIGEHLTDQIFNHAKELTKVHADRIESVLRLWGPAVEQLEILRHLVLEWSFKAQEKRQGTYSHPNTAFALHSLVERAFEITGEIVVLIRSGYADGALARWRSLHEVCVVAMFLAPRSDKCAEMYLSHHWVEESRLLEIDKGSGTARHENPHKDRYKRDLRLKVAALSSQFGEKFSSDYGWAAVDLGCARTKFRDLENHVGLETLRRGYRQANNTVHGGALATLTRISLGPGVDKSAHSPLAYGCEVAANYTAASLSMMVAELCLETESAEILTMNMVIYNQARKIIEHIEKVQQRITRASPREKILARRAALRASRKENIGKRFVR